MSVWARILRVAGAVAVLFVCVGTLVPASADAATAPVLVQYNQANNGGGAATLVFSTATSASDTVIVDEECNGVTSSPALSSSGFSLIGTTGISSGDIVSVWAETGTSVTTVATTGSGPGACEVAGMEWSSLPLADADVTTIDYGALTSTNNVSPTYTATALDEETLVFVGTNEDNTSSCLSPFTTVDYEGRGGSLSQCYGASATTSTLSSMTAVDASNFTWYGAILMTFGVTPGGGMPPSSTTTTTGGGTTTSSSTTSTTDGDGGARPLTGSSAASSCDFWDPECWFSYLFEPSSAAVTSFDSGVDGSSWVSNWSSNMTSVGTLTGDLVSGGYTDYEGCLPYECGCPDIEGADTEYCYGGAGTADYCIADSGTVPAEVVDGELDMSGAGDDGPGDLCYYQYQVTHVSTLSGFWPIMRDLTTFGIIVLTLMGVFRMVTRFLQSGT